MRPAQFGYNVQTAATNRFQQQAGITPDTAARACVEFERLRAGLSAAGVRVCAVDDTVAPVKPDAVFPNNWVSFHRDGTIVLYPMQADNRRAERRWDVIAEAQAQLQFRRRRLLDLRRHEREGRFLEGTGSLVLDHVQRIAYACRSERTEESLVRVWSRQMDYEPLLFDACGRDGTALYHTNVVLCIGSRWAAVCSEAIAQADRTRVLQRLRGCGRELIELSLSALDGFAANMLELSGKGASGAPRTVLLMSESAHVAWQRSDAQCLRTLSGQVDQVLVVAVPTIETVGGGSVRCMVAEVPECTLL